MSEKDRSEGCIDGEHDDSCPICRGEMSPDFVERIKQAGSSPASKPMTKEQFLAWLRDLG